MSRRLECQVKIVSGIDVEKVELSVRELWGKKCLEFGREAMVLTVFLTQKPLQALLFPKVLNVFNRQNIKEW